MTFLYGIDNVLLDGLDSFTCLGFDEDTKYRCGIKCINTYGVLVLVLWSGQFTPKKKK